MTQTWLTGPALDVVRTLPDASVDLVATSPPFLALRDYNGVAGQWGSEPTPAAFLDNLLALATELRRVLAPHGSLCFELGDTYSGAGQGNIEPRQLRPGATPDGYINARKVTGPGWPPAKSLCGVPTLFAWSLAYGRNLLNPAHTFEPWLVRNVIVWARNNPPVGALGDKVRPATSYITVACPSPRRWFDLDAVRGPGSPNSHARTAKGVAIAPNETKSGAAGRGGGWSTLNEIHQTAGAPPLDHWHDEYDGDHTWLINTQGSSLAHYAMWPAKLAERLVLAMCPREVCVGCGEPRRRITGATPEYAEAIRRQQEIIRPHANGNNRTNPTRLASGSGASTGAKGGLSVPRVDYGMETLGWSVCACPTPTYRPGIVLDPFSGTGTTVHTAEVHGRDGIGIDLDPINATLRDRRRDEVRRNLLDVAPEVPGQLTLEALL